MSKHMKTIQAQLKAIGINVPDSTVKGVARKLKASVAHSMHQIIIIHYFQYSTYYYPSN